MKQLPISKFKATCLAVIAEVGKTGEPVVITRFGHPLAEVVPHRQHGKIQLGGLAKETRILGDIISPACDESEWEALR